MNDDTRLVYLRAPAEPNTLVVVDAGRRTYLGLSNDGSYFHALRPARLDDPIVGDGKKAVGALLCSCVAAAYGRDCRWTTLATALERGDVGHKPVLLDDDITWLQQPAPELQEAAR